jgi:hypothetical protein
MNNKDSFINLDIFSKERKLYFLYKKTEKIISAIYMVTDFLSDSEPAKWALRESGVRLIEDVFQYSLGDKLSSNLKNLQADFLRTLSLLEVSHLSGFISTMNFRIIADEFKSLLDHLELIHRERISAGGVLLSGDFFGVDISSLDTKDTNKDSYSVNKTEDNLSSKNHSSQHRLDKGHELSSGSIVSGSGSISSAISREIKGHQTSLIREIKQNVKNARRDSILAVLNNRGGGLTIKDVSDVVKGCSEKTIQRELQELIQEGILRKEGERRWSKYYINKPKN